jgi:ornithine lipid hydroxylase
MPNRNLVFPVRVDSIAWRSLRWLAWPFALAIASIAAWLLMQSPESAMELQMATMVVAVLLVVFLERMLPLRQDWRSGAPQEWRTDLTSMVVLMAVADPIVKRGLLPLVASICVPWLTANAALNWFPTHWPILVQLAFAAIVAEFGQYWVHRAMHKVRWMCGLHGFHHNPTRIYWLNGFRANPLNMIAHQLAGLGVLVAIGTPSIVVQVLILFSTVAAVFQHANADLRYDGWNWIFSTADLHRWHHASGSQTCQANFGGLLSIWDLAFGTYRNASDVPRTAGVDAGAPRAKGYVSALIEAMRNAFAR